MLLVMWLEEFTGIVRGQKAPSPPQARQLADREGMYMH